jgi:uncharacterized membrane protein
MTAELTAALTLVGMSAITFATRAGGAWMVSFLPMTKRLRLVLRHMASSVMVALVVGGAARGDAAAWLALATSVAVMLATRRALPAMAAAILAAAGWRALAGG